MVVGKKLTHVIVLVIFFLMIRRPPRSTQGVSSAASDVYKRQVHGADTRHYIIPYSSGLQDLWVRVTDNPDKPTEVIRNPSKTTSNFAQFKANPFLIQQQQREQRRLSLLVPVNEQEAGELFVLGSSELKVEYEGFVHCKKPKNIEIEPDDLNKEQQYDEDLMEQKINFPQFRSKQRTQL
eukprot:TRINITY_DN7195_c0_g1_i1.p1 TRINITY_DN7195_c0_g1~~TRINITY_DN7195_c0_g1_i1.p1  ORF type:complete len:180 (+),score=33.25 TRINITY_DN7195_c0_g1_i1:82-621(+)